jgi:hypothetical protein
VGEGLLFVEAGSICERGLFVFDGSEVEAGGGGDAAEGEEAVPVEEASGHALCEDISTSPADFDISLGPALPDEVVLEGGDFLVDEGDLAVEVVGLVKKILKFCPGGLEPTHRKTLIYMETRR